MNIPVLYEIEDAGKDQTYVLLEFQGQMEREENLDLEGMELGALEKLNDKQYVMKVGIHDISGKVEKLKQSMAVARKEMRDGKLCVVVKKILDSKIIFKDRPTPMLERAASESALGNVNPRRLANQFALKSKAPLVQE